MLYSTILTAIFVFSSPSYGAVVRGRQVAAPDLQSPDLPSAGSSIDQAAASILAGGATAPAAAPQVPAPAPSPAVEAPRPAGEPQPQAGPQAVNEPRPQAGNTPRPAGEQSPRPAGAQSPQAGNEPRPAPEQQQQPSGQRPAQAQPANGGNGVEVPLAQPIDTPLDPNVILDSAQGIPPTQPQSIPDGGNLAASGGPISTPLPQAGTPNTASNPQPAQPIGQGQQNQPGMNFSFSP
jgi:hypothetical protein